MNIPEFGIKRENEERRDGGCGIVFDPKTNMFAIGKVSETGALRLFSGGVDPAEDIQAGVIREVIEESGLYDFSRIEYIGQALAHYYNPLRQVNRVAAATCFLIILNTTDLKPVQLEEHEKFSLVWVTADEIYTDWQARNQDENLSHWLYFMDLAKTKLKELGYIL